jgi:branched-chain amino acid transport system permease protein
MEATLIRPLYERHTYQIMLTFGLAFVGVEIVRAVWGRDQFTIPNPSLFANTDAPCPATTLGGWFANGCGSMQVSIAGNPATIRTYNEIFVILVGLIVLVSVWLLLQRTRLGMIIRAGVQDSEMVEALGINVRRVFTLVFGLGVAIAALGGVLHGTSGGVSDGMGVSLLLGALIALAIGGLTSYPGAALGAVIVGLVQQYIIKYGELGIRLPWQDAGKAFKPSPPFVDALPVVLMVIILIVMPQGLLGRKD